jgi:hypothetical protein
VEWALIFAISGAVSAAMRRAISGGGIASWNVLQNSDGTLWRPLVPVISWMAREHGALMRA